MNYDNFVTKEQILTLVRAQQRQFFFQNGLICVDEDTKKHVVFQGYTLGDMINPLLPLPGQEFPFFHPQY